MTAYAFELLRHDEGRVPPSPLEEGLEPEAADDLRPRRADEHRCRHRLGRRRPAVVAWVFTFGALSCIGIPFARYRDGNGNVLWDSTSRTGSPGTAATRSAHVSIVGSEVGNTHAILAIGLVFGAVSLAAIRRWRPVHLPAAWPCSAS